MSTNTIKVSDEHLQFIHKALELYVCCSIGQFERIVDLPSVQKNTFKENPKISYSDLEDELRVVKSKYTGVMNGGPGIFNEEQVTEDAREAMNIHDQIRHHLWKKGDQVSKHTVNARDAMEKLIEIE